MLTFTKFIALVIGFLISLADLRSHVNGMDLYEGNSCKMKDGRVGVCTKLPECESIEQALQMKTFPLGDLFRCSFVGLTEIICCPDKTPENLVSTTPRRNHTGIIFPDDIELSSSTQTREPNITSDPKSSSRIFGVTASKACMMYSQNFSRRLGFNIFNGQPTALGEFPHMVALGYPDFGEGVTMWKCGGSLISDRYVLTAAHCVRRPEGQPTLIRLGTNNLNVTADSTIDVGVELITLNPKYWPQQYYHDIALIRLNVTVQFNNNIRPACLYTDPGDIQPNLPLVVTGWGRTSNNNSATSDLLLKVNLAVVGLESCNKSIVGNGGLQQRLPNGLNEGQLCTFDPALKSDACEGDSGGPLQITNESGVSTVVGVVSFGFFCASSLPGVYARVSFYVNWIEDIVWAGGIMS